jgi:hypothetical protein
VTSWDDYFCSCPYDGKSDGGTWSCALRYLGDAACVYDDASTDVDADVSED